MSSESEQEEQFLESNHSDSDLWRIYSKIPTSPDLNKAYSSISQPITRKAGLKELITATSKALTYDFSKVFDYFSFETNPNDSKDQINFKKIGLEAFKRRIGNHLLEQIFLRNKTDETLKEFVESTREDEDKEGSKYSSDPAKEEKEKVYDESSEEKEIPKKPQEKTVSTEKLSKKPTNSMVRNKPVEREITNKSEPNSENPKKILKNPTLSSPEKKKTKLVMNKSSSSDKESVSSIVDYGLSNQVIDETRKKVEKNSDSDSSSEKTEKVDLLFGLMAGQNVDTNKLLEILDPAKKINQRASPFPSKKWFSDFIEDCEKDVKQVFLKFAKKNDCVSAKDLFNVFTAVIAKLDLDISERFKDSFKQISEKLHPTKVEQKGKKKGKVVYAEINYSEFVDLMNLWGVDYSKDQEKVSGHLAKTIKEYADLKYLHSDIEKLVPTLSSLIGSLEKCLAAHLSTYREDKALQEKHKKHLEDIFQFYAKVQRIQGTDDTFEAMEISNTAWNLGTFLKFSTDFNLTQGKTEGGQGLNKEQLIIIFKKTANNTRLMSEIQFIEALDRISEVFYSPELDKLMETAYAYLPVIEKRELLYKHLGLQNFQKYHKKKKAFGIAFSPEKYSRVPYSESSHKYKFKIDDSSQKKLELWKNSKVLRSTPPLLRPIKEVQKNSQSFVKKNPNVIPGSGYALRLKAKKVQVYQKTEEINESSEEEVVKKVDLTYSQPKILTIKALESLEYKDIDNEYDLKDLISDDHDEFFDKLYGIEPKLQGIMKMHDVKLAKGKKVLEKNRYSYKYS